MQGAAATAVLLLLALLLAASLGEPGPSRREPSGGLSAAWAGLRARRRAPAGWQLGRWARARSTIAEGEAGEVRRLASGARTGQPMVGALQAVASAGGPWASEAQRVVAAVHQGAALHDELEAWVERTGSHGARLAVDAVVLAERSGGSSAEALEAVARSLAQRAELEREVAAASASARASAMVLVAMPGAFALVVSVADPRVARLLLATPLGWTCLASAIALDAAGAWWMQRSVARVAR